MSDQNKTVMMEGVRIIFRNFAGAEGMYNRAGDRNFTVVLPPETAEAMKEDGWNVKFKEPRSAEEDGIFTLQVSVGYKIRPPRVVIITSKGRTSLPEEMVDLLDWVDMANVDLIVRPYHWSVSGNTGVKAYLQSIYVTIQEDELEKKYADVPIAELDGPDAPKALSSGPTNQHPNDLIDKANQDEDVVDAELVEE